MATIDVTPKVVNLVGWAGDTIPVKITAPTAFIAGRVWTAHVKASFDSTVVDAVLLITPPVVADGPAFLQLSGADTARLAALGGAASAVTRLGGSGASPVKYTGVWDCQLAPVLGGDPTTTLTYGTVVIRGDVTRVV